jgi:hypothetical protein
MTFDVVGTGRHRSLLHNAQASGTLTLSKMLADWLSVPAHAREGTSSSVRTTFQANNVDKVGTASASAGSNVIVDAAWDYQYDDIDSSTITFYSDVNSDAPCSLYEESYGRVRGSLGLALRETTGVDVSFDVLGKQVPFVDDGVPGLIYKELTVTDRAGPTVLKVTGLDKNSRSCRPDMQGVEIPKDDLTITIDRPTQQAMSRPGTIDIDSGQASLASAHLFTPLLTAFCVGATAF